ncbi:MAG: hypothetical protein ACTHLW_07550 [Verrucomicrobiota bacterium]
MKNNLLKNVLDWVLATSVLLSVVFFVQFYFRTKDFRTTQASLQLEMAKYQNNRQMLPLLINDTLEYNKAHPDVNLTRILESIGVGKAAPGTKPATK